MFTLLKRSFLRNLYIPTIPKLLSILGPATGVDVLVAVRFGHALGIARVGCLPHPPQYTPLAFDAFGEPERGGGCAGRGWDVHVLTFAICQFQTFEALGDG